jgi:hypothetical protein
VDGLVVLKDIIDPTHLDSVDEFMLAEVDSLYNFSFDLTLTLRTEYDHPHKKKLTSCRFATESLCSFLFFYPDDKKRK